MSEDYVAADETQIEIREDGFLDESRGFTTGLGGSYEREKASLKAMTDLYDSNWLARVIIETLPDTVLKGGVTFGDDSLLTTFNVANTHPLNPEGQIHNGMCQGRLHGGYVLAVLPLRGDPTMPWKPSDGYAHIIGDAWSACAKDPETDPNSPQLGLPRSYQFSSNPYFAQLKIHASRCVLFEGPPKAKQTIEAPWCSLLEIVFNEIVDFGLSWTAVSQLIREASLLWLRMSGLAKGIALGKANDAVQGRLKFNARTKSIMNMLFLDEGEEAGRIAVSFADLPQLMNELSVRVAAAARLPVTKIFGRSPAGMNATGESDMRQFYDSAIEYREKSARPKIIKFCELVSGITPAQVLFKPLWEPTAKEAEELRKFRFEADKLSWELGSVDARAILLSRAKDGTLGYTLPEAFLADLEQALKVVQKPNSLELSVTTAELFTRVNEARKKSGLEDDPDPIFGAKTLAQVRAEMAAMAAIESAGKAPGNLPPDPATLP